ncbi:MAG: aspartate carbamoyltransferase regulatory subunit [Tissierellia bacterium]|jgi:aspartate carbamoyltransferase regulatory subunit|nr:aspartate carbamoyltransferase regulatory subunit [Bacillota bacterium]NLK57942.1 aspartate carbamoyltransferase regulatory subunit [Tissierellia bacterium]
MLNIDSIRRGIVIDHIQPGNGFKIFQYLNLDKVDYRVALIINAISKKKGRKDIIKIENVIDLDFKFLGALDDEITINIVEDEVITEKIRLEMPDRIEGIFTCKNPRCITTNERNIVQRFSLLDRESKSYKCDYCDNIYTWEE